MDITQNLIFVKGEDQTARIQRISQGKQKIRILYNGSYNRPYFYEYHNVSIYQAKETINVSNQRVYVKGKRQYDVQSIISFGKYSRIIFRGNNLVCLSRHLKLVPICTASEKVEDRLSYLKSLAYATGLLVENDVNLLARLYDSLDLKAHDTVLNSYISDTPYVDTYSNDHTLIYPYGINQSQQKAVENAFTSQISIIEGPPGTGKTQTILNILANLIIQNKSVAVVSNNNYAISNVVEKLAKDQLDDYCALLGNSTNKAQFIEKQRNSNTNDKWKNKCQSIDVSISRIEKLTQEIGQALADQLRIAEIDDELDRLIVERAYYARFYDNPDDGERLCNLNISSSKALKLLAEIEHKESHKLGLFSRIAVRFKYGKNALKIYSADEKSAIETLSLLYYSTRINELKAESDACKKRLSDFNFADKYSQLQVESMDMLKGFLYKKYHSENRDSFTLKGLKSQSQKFVSQYPIILSTTLSLKNSLSADYIYDYLIIDEASQVDIQTGAIALSCARNVVIVGDCKQLPNVVTNEDIARIEKSCPQSVDPAFNYRKSLLESACEVWKDAPVTLLREHYRCHPKIIGFCNQKFYNNQLSIMTNDASNSDVLKMYITPKGNHARGRYNQREVDVILNEVLPELKDSGYTDIGIITPYRNQVALLRKALGDSVDISTVHKFQGREKEAIILSSVDNEIGEFVDDQHMLNVAVSRAKHTLRVVTSHNTKTSKGNYGDLLRYIKYNNYEVVEGKTVSVFDLLYKAYNKERRSFLKRKGRISEYDSENIAHALLSDILSDDKYSGYEVGCHVRLSDLMSDDAIFTPDQLSYGKNPLTHVDFLIFSKIDKTPVLGIEIDGVAFHMPKSRQAERDRIKDDIFKTINIPLLRLRTDGSLERKRICTELDQIIV